MKAKDLARHGARLDHHRHKIHAIKRDLRSQPAEINSSLHLAMLQLAYAIDALDRAAGEQARRELSD